MDGGPRRQFLHLEETWLESELCTSDGVALKILLIGTVKHDDMHKKNMVI